ncbi:Pyrrolidone-carboxylate peptidase [Nocardiopsis dassonvillei]|uniref:pyroglutamyl peptidase n=1 Tax=Nocardiopsis dassonvillei TaxID=2014 RepID=UPI003F570A7E
MHHDTTPEEDRARLDVPRRILERSGFGAAVPLFTADLNDAADPEAARQAVTAHASRLWTEAARTDVGTVDDRPLYWARLLLAARLRTWRPPFDLTDRDRTALLHLLETASRGITELHFPPGEHLLRIAVTGFDPFHLDRDPACANPSGAAALDLNGWTFPVAGRTAVVRTAVFPVRWADFDAGLVEQALGRVHGQADAVLTLSRGRPDRFDLEVWNGVWRGGGTDNLGVARTGRALPEDAPEWTRSTLPLQEIADSVDGPVVVNTEVTEIPAGATEPVVRPDGPTPGSAARSGGGGDYLSNEIAYRNTLLRDRAGSSAPAGHVHLPRTGSVDEHAPVLARVREIVAAVARTLA